MSFHLQLSIHPSILGDVFKLWLQHITLITSTPYAVLAKAWAQNPVFFCFPSLLSLFLPLSSSLWVCLDVRVSKGGPYLAASLPGRPTFLALLPVWAQSKFALVASSGLLLSWPAGLDCFTLMGEGPAGPSLRSFRTGWRLHPTLAFN